MKSYTYIEYKEVKVEDKALIVKAKEIWVELGNKIKDIETLKLYVKPEEMAVYYVFNDDVSGFFPL